MTDIYVNIFMSTPGTENPLNFIILNFLPRYCVLLAAAILNIGFASFAAKLYREVKNLYLPPFLFNLAIDSPGFLRYFFPAGIRSSAEVPDPAPMIASVSPTAL